MPFSIVVYYLLAVKYTQMFKSFLVGMSCYSSKHVSPKSYTHSPHVSSSIKKKQPSSLDLLKLGTSESSECKTNTGIIRPKPIEVLNERRKLHSRKSLDKTEMHNEMCGAMINKEYVDALDKAKDGVKLSDNVKEKMSSLLKAIKDEQSLVENDLERKSKEMTLEEDKFSPSFGKKRKYEKPSKTERHENRGSRDKHGDHKVENIKVPTPYKYRKPVEPDVRDDTKHTFDRNLHHKLKESQSQSSSMDTADNFDHKDERKSFGRPSIIENRQNDRSGNSDIVHYEALGNRSKCRNTSIISSETSQNDSVKWVGPMNINSIVSHMNYSPRTKVVKQSSKIYDKHESSQSINKGNDWQLDKNVSGKFVEMFNDATTPKSNKHAFSDPDENEYVDIISPFDHMSASKRQTSERKQRLISSGKKKCESSNYKPVRPKAVVKPDSWKETLLQQKNGDSTVSSSQNKANLSVTTDSSKGHLQDSDSEDVDSDIEIVLDKRRETDEDISQDSTRRKSFDKASGKIRNLKKNEIKFRGYDLYVKKERQGNQRIQRNDHRTLVSSRSDQSNAKKDAVQSRESATNHKMRETTHATGTLRTEAVTFGKERCVYSHRSTIADTHEQVITPIPKAGMHNEPTTERDSPEIVYRSKNVSEKGNRRQLSQAKTSKYNNCANNDGQQRNLKQRKSAGRQIDKSSFSNIVDSNLDLVKSRSERRPVGAEDYNLCNTKINSQSISDDPFEFSGTPGSSMKKVNREFDGIGERIEQKRSKVKKKARKSLMFEQDDSDNCEEADNDMQSDHSSDLLRNAYGVEADCYMVENRELDRKRLGTREINIDSLGNREIYKNTVERREIMERKNHDSIQNKSPAVVNKEFPNRKRPLSHDIRASPANLVTIEKKTKGSIGQTITGTCDVAGKRLKLSQALDTTYTIDSFKLKQKHN